jgi:large subunit ribosomal protein L9
MATTNVLLREDIEHLGARGEIVRVKAGYARNYLLPRRLAVEATKGNVRQIEQERAALLKKEAGEKATAAAQGEQLGRVKLVFERKAGDQGLLYGSVTTMDIADELKAKGYEIDRRRISLKDPIKSTGEFTVTIKLHREVNVELPVTVTDGSAPVEAPAAAPEAPAAAPEAEVPAAEAAEAPAE